jgi:multicomponent K+:H+ antiporter subunit D
MAVITVATTPAWTAGFYYLLHSTWGAAAMFLLVGLISARRGLLADQLRSGNTLHPVLGILFIVLAVMLTGLPPLSGFIGKLLLLQAVPVGLFWVVLLGSSLVVLVAFSRAGSTVFWRQQQSEFSGVMPFGDLLPLLLLLVMTLALVVFAGSTYEAVEAVATQLMNSQLYIDAVLGEQGAGQ